MLVCEIVGEGDFAFRGEVESRFGLRGAAVQVGEDVAVDEDFVAGTGGADGGTVEAGELIAGDGDVFGVLENDAMTNVELDGILVFEETFLLTFADVAVAEVVRRDREATAIPRDFHSEVMHQGEGICRDRAAMGVAEVDPAPHVVGDDVRGKGDAVTVAVKDDRCAVAFLDHVARDHGTVGVFDDDTIAEVVVDVVAVQAEVEGINASEGVLVFLEVVRVHDDIVASIEEESCFLIIGQDRVGDARVFVAIDQGDTVSAMMIDGDALNK